MKVYAGELNNLGYWFLSATLDWGEPFPLPIKCGFPIWREWVKRRFDDRERCLCLLTL